ncbi:putative Alpha amylase catalytic region [metagenome]|uniref:Putative Alpha amylase catalytic region n=1 Tax=metagenome TaxID=256318 RepID=A0A2P2CBW4_9ZZZZ
MTSKVDPLDPHHDGSPLYTLTEVPVLGGRVPLRVRVPHRLDGSPGAVEVVLRAVTDGEPAIRKASQVEVDAAGAWWEVEVELVNPLTSYRFLVSSGPDDYRWLNAVGVHRRDVTDAGDFKISTLHQLPSWVPDQIGYQVFPDRFARTETGVALPDWAMAADWDDPVIHQGPQVPYQVYGGTLDGVAAHLDHLTGLGATLLYLTPVFEAHSNHRYDAVSFDRVDPLLGGDAALDRLLQAAHAQGLRVVGDLTTNHTGDFHEWFLTALAEPTSAERGFYRFDGDDYVSWLGIPTLPKLDHTSRELASRLYDGPGSVVATWVERGLDGWRIDVANMTGRLGADDLAHQVAQDIRRTIASIRPDGWLLAEHGHDASQDLAGAGWHGTMDYAGFTRPLWCWLNGGSPGSTGPGAIEHGAIEHGLTYLGLPVDIPVLAAEAVVATMREVHGAMPWTSWMSSTMHLDSHDVPRFRTVAGGGVDGGIDREGHGRHLHLVGLGLQMTMPGVPVVFMGDELGLTGVDGEHARTPYPWSRPETWDSPTLDAYRDWIALRHQHVALRRGSLRWLHASGDCLTFVREHADEVLLVHANRTDTGEVSLPSHALGPGGAALTTVVGSAASVQGEEIVLPGTRGVSVYAADRLPTWSPTP